eukprot:scaffold479_cov376-Prasinococcus_capsulatus_cf.AAC.4
MAAERRGPGAGCDTFEFKYGQSVQMATVPSGSLGPILKVRQRTPARPVTLVGSPAEVPPDFRDLLRAALAAPVGCPPLEQLAKSGQRVAISTCLSPHPGHLSLLNAHGSPRALFAVCPAVSDDVTRKTPAAEIIPILVEELLAAGVKEDDVTVVIALGTHRVMTAEELEAKLGAGIVARFAVANYPCTDPSRFVNMGVSKSGIPAWVNTAVASADLCIGLGTIFPHMSSGYSGGCKIVLPGVCNHATVEEFHARECFSENRPGDEDCPMRKDMEGFVMENKLLDFIVNVVTTREGAVVK